MVGLRALSGRLVAVVALSLLPLVGAAQSLSSKPVRIIVSFQPGGSVDRIARIISPKLLENLGQPIIAENRPGAAGRFGVDVVAKSNPDGRTILTPFGIPQ